MTQNCLPEIEIRLDKSRKNFQPIIHSINKFGKKKSINTQRYDWVKQTALQQNQNDNPFVRISFTNKTALFKRKRITSIQNGHRGMLAPLQTHITRKSIILNQQPRCQTEPSISEMKGCKSFLNPKQQSRKSLVDLGQKSLGQYGQGTKKRSNNSLIDIVSVQNLTPHLCKQQKEQFILSPWGDKQNEEDKQKRLGRFR